MTRRLTLLYIIVCLGCATFRPGAEEPWTDEPQWGDNTAVGATRSYRQFVGTNCDWCKRPGTLLNRLHWAHFYPQALSVGDKEYLRYAATNGCTLHARCHFVLGHYDNPGKRYCVGLKDMIETYNVDAMGASIKHEEH